MARKSLPAKERFMKFVSPEPNSGCWLWTGGTVQPGGYGVFAPRTSPQTTAHRVSWMLFVGPIPDGLQVCHHCDVRLCVNPDHLFLGTSQDNHSDMVRKKRGTRSKYGLPRGVHRSQGRKRYSARVKANGKVFHLGQFDTPEEASRAAEAARERLFEDLWS